MSGKSHQTVPLKNIYIGPSTCGLPEFLILTAGIISSVRQVTSNCSFKKKYYSDPLTGGLPHPDVRHHIQMFVKLFHSKKKYFIACVSLVEFVILLASIILRKMIDIEGPLS